MEALGPAQLVFCALVVMAAFAVRGTTGFGGNAIAVPLLTLVLIGARLGGFMAGRINQLLFNCIVGAVLMCSGVVLLFK